MIHFIFLQSLVTLVIIYVNTCDIVISRGTCKTLITYFDAWHYMLTNPEKVRIKPGDFKTWQAIEKYLK
jgi:hypothetical protein